MRTDTAARWPALRSLLGVMALLWGIALAGAAADHSTPAHQRRQADLEQAQDHQAEASRQLDRAIGRLAELSRFEAARRELVELLAEHRQNMQDLQDLSGRTMGRRLDELPRADRDALEALGDKHAGLAQKVENALRNLDQFAAALARTDRAAAEAMAGAAGIGRQSGMSGNLGRAGKAIAGNQTGEGVIVDRNVEIGLLTMVRKLDEVRRGQLEQLQRQLAELHAKVDLLVKRQAGHNLDNLILQSSADADLLKTLAAKAGRARALEPRNELSDLIKSQEQTQRNTRSCSNDAMGVPKLGEQIAATLASAAASMDRALVELAESRLARAYMPPQVEALGSLEEAMKLVIQARKDNQDEIDAEDEKAIREELAALRDAEQKLKEQTVRIDAAPRNPDGQLARRQTLEAMQVSGEQVKLAGRVDKLLARLPGKVYVWALRDVGQSMRQVSDDLARQNVGQSTQSEQQRIIDQLDAMARNLELDRDDSVFEPRPPSTDPTDGGDPPPTPPQIPTEAELRLLRDLQTAINRATRSAAAAAPDVPRLKGLGARQDELQKMMRELLRELVNRPQ